MKSNWILVHFVNTYILITCVIILEEEIQFKLLLFIEQIQFAGRAIIYCFTVRDGS